MSVFLSQLWTVKVGCCLWNKQKWTNWKKTGSYWDLDTAHSEYNRATNCNNRIVK